MVCRQPGQSSPHEALHLSFAHARQSSLSGQRDRLKGAHKRVLDIANSLGVSDQVLRMIEKRDFFDKLIVYGGIVVTLCVFFGLLYVFSGAGSADFQIVLNVFLDRFV